MIPSFVEDSADMRRHRRTAEAPDRVGAGEMPKHPIDGWQPTKRFSAARCRVRANGPSAVKASA